MDVQEIGAGGSQHPEGSKEGGAFQIAIEVQMVMESSCV